MREPLTSPELAEIGLAAEAVRAHVKLAATLTPSAPAGEATALGEALADAIAAVNELATLAANAERGRLDAEERLREMRVRAGGLS